MDNYLPFTTEEHLTSHFHDIMATTLAHDDNHYTVPEVKVYSYTKSINFKKVLKTATGLLKKATASGVLFIAMSHQLRVIRKICGALEENFGAAAPESDEQKPEPPLLDLCQFECGVERVLEDFWKPDELETSLNLDMLCVKQQQQLCLVLLAKEELTMALKAAMAELVAADADDHHHRRRKSGGSGEKLRVVKIQKPQQPRPAMVVAEAAVAVNNADT